MKFYTLETPALYKGLIHGALELSKNGKAAPPCIRKVAIPEIKAIDTKARTIEHYISSDREDRDFDVIDQDGYIYTEYDRNSVVLEGHRYDLRPIAKNLEHAVETIGEDKFTRALTGYPDEGIKASSDEDFNMRVNDFLRTWSVGFRPIEWGWREDRGVHFFTQIMLEYSSISIPANVDAMDLGIGAEGAMKAFFACLYPGQVFDKRLLENIMNEAARKAIDEKRSETPVTEALKAITEGREQLRDYVLRSELSQLTNAWCNPSTAAVQPQGADVKNNNRDS